MRENDFAIYNNYNNKYIVVDYIFEYSKKLLSYAMTKHGSKEMAYAINLNTLDFIGAEFGTSKSVNIASLVDRIDDSEYIFHNPQYGCFNGYWK